MLRFCRGTQGSVSVYMIMILVPIFIFQALFIDLIRVRLADRISETALKAGLRSVMSAYEPTLQKYGLYGLVWDEDKRAELFKQVIEQNLNTGSEDSGVFRYLDTRSNPEMNQIKTVYTLANPAVLKRQIAQEMKVRAPVEFLTELTDRFKKTGAAPAFSAGADYYDKIGKLEALHWKREEALDQTWADVQDLIAAAKTGLADAGRDLAKLQELAGRIGLTSITEIRRSITETQSAISGASGHADIIRQSISSLRLSLSELTKAAKENAEAITAIQSDIAGLELSLSTVQNELSNLISKRNSLEQVLRDMTEYTTLFAASKLKVQAHEAAVDAVYRRFDTSLASAEAVDEEWRTEADLLRQGGSHTNTVANEWFQTEAAYTREYFGKYRTGAARLSAAFHGISAHWLDVEWWNSAKWDVLLANATALETQTSSFEAERKTEEARRDKRNKDLNRDEQAERSKIRSALGELSQALGSCGIGVGGDPFKEYYEQLEGDGGLTEKYRKAKDTEASDTGVAKNADRAIEKGMGILKRLGDMLQGFRDELFVNEFVLEKFNYRTSGITAASGGVTAVSTVTTVPTVPARSEPETHPLSNQEREYILYGFNSCASNQSAAYGEMFLMLFGIRTIEALMEPKTQAMQAAGTPMLGLLVAASKGATQALADSRALTEGASVPILKKLGSLEVRYKDVLRIFLLLHPNQSAVLSRLQALLELNTGVDLTTAASYIQGNGGTSVKLWFMPGIMWMLNRTTGLGCRIEQGRCQITKMAVYSYD